MGSVRIEPSAGVILQESVSICVKEKVEVYAREKRGPCKRTDLEQWTKQLEHSPPVCGKLAKWWILSHRLGAMRNAISPSGSCDFRSRSVPSQFCHFKVRVVVLPACFGYASCVDFCCLLRPSCMRFGGDTSQDEKRPVTVKTKGQTNSKTRGPARRRYHMPSRRHQFSHAQTSALKAVSRSLLSAKHHCSRSLHITGYTSGKTSTEISWTVRHDKMSTLQSD